MKNNTDLKRKNSLIFNIADVPSQIVPSSNIISLGLNIVNTFNNSNRSIFIILSSLYECQTLYDILLEYIDKNKVCLFVNDEIVSSNTLTQSKEFDIECVNTMYKLSFGKEKIITITNVTGYMTLLCDKQTFQSRILNLKTGDYLIYLCIDILFTILPAVCIFTGMLKVLLPSIICVAGSILSLAALLIFEGENMRRELRRKLHL